MANIARQEARQGVAVTARKEKGIAALAEEFGPTALAPVARSQIHATERGDATLADRQTQQLRDNKRQDKTDIENDTAASLERRMVAGRRTVAFVKAGMNKGVPMGEIISSASQAMTELGVPQEEQLQVGQMLTDDPDTIHSLEAMFAKDAKQGVRRATKKFEITNGDGSTTTYQGYNDGTSEVVPGRLTKTVQAQERIETAQQRAADTKAGKASELRRKNLAALGKELVANQKKATFHKTKARAAKTVVRDIGNMRKLTDRIQSFDTSEPGQTLAEAVDRAVEAKILGTDEADVAAFINSIKSNIGIDTLLGIKASGAGLGQVPQSQLETLQSVLGNLDINRSPELLLNDLRDIETMYNDIITGIEQSNAVLAERDTQLRERRDVLEQTQFGDIEQEEPEAEPLSARAQELQAKYGLGD